MSGAVRTYLVARCVRVVGTSMFKSRSGLPHVPVRARLELGCTRPSQAIMAAWLIALEATRAPDWCRAGELQHHVVGSAHAVMTK